MCICVCDVYVCVFVLVYVCWIMCACVCTLCVQNISCDTTLIVSAPDITLLIFLYVIPFWPLSPPLSNSFTIDYRGLAGISEFDCHVYTMYVYV